MRFTKTLGLVSILVVAACGEREAPEPSSGGSASNAAPAWLLASAPDGAVDVAAAKQTAEEGDEIVLRGRIGGRVDPMSEDSPVFIVMDPSIPSCGESDVEDGCKTPWDYCCETPEAIAANNATIQLVGSDGAAVDADLREHGLAPSDTVVVVGTVGPRPSPQVLTVKATRIYKES